MSIQPLPGDVVAQIKSSVVITSVNSVIVGLIANSLDAQASRINVSVDYSRGNCSVEDNGSGIPPSEIKEGGGLGQLHCMCAPVLHHRGPRQLTLIFAKTRPSILPIRTSTGNMEFSLPPLHPCRCCPSPRTTETSTLTTP